MSTFDVTKVRDMTIFILLLVLSSTFETCSSVREGNHLKLIKKVEEGYGGSGGGGGRRKLLRFVGSSYTRSIPDESLVSKDVNFNVLDFGAKGDGHTDDTKVINWLFFLFYGL